MKKVKLRLKEVRESREWTQENLAQKMGLSLSHYRKIENQRTKALTYEVLDKMVEVLDCHISELLTVEESK